MFKHNECFNNFNRSESAIVYTDGSFADGVVSSSGIVINHDILDKFNSTEFENLESLTEGMVYDFKSRLVEEFQFFLDSTKLSAHRNVSGEILAVMYSIYSSYKMGYKNLLVFHDYEGVSKWASGEWRAKTELTAFYMEFLKNFKGKGFQVYFCKVKAHHEDVLNNYVDKLSKKTLRYRKLKGKFVEDFISNVVSKVIIQNNSIF